MRSPDEIIAAQEQQKKEYREKLEKLASLMVETLYNDRRTSTTFPLSMINTFCNEAGTGNFFSSAKWFEDFKKILEDAGYTIQPYYETERSFFGLKKSQKLYGYTVSVAE